MSAGRIPFMDEVKKERRGRGCIVAVIVLVGGIGAFLVVSLIYLGVTAGDPDSFGAQLWLVIGGEKEADLLITEIIVDRLTKRAGVPPDEAAALKRELGPISEQLPRLSEGEKNKLAQLIREAIADGRVPPEEIAVIRDYSYKSARDGNSIP